MAYTVEQVIKDVRKLLDEEALDSSAFTADGQTASTEADDTELDELIRSRIVEARNFVLGGCDVSMLREDCEVITSDDRPGAPIKLEALFTGLRVGLYPSDAVLRLASVKGDTWKRAVTEFIPFEDGAYAMLQDPYSTGTPQSPKAAEGYSLYEVENPEPEPEPEEVQEEPAAETREVSEVEPTSENQEEEQETQEGEQDPEPEPEQENWAVELYSWVGEDLTAEDMNYALRYVKSYTLGDMMPPEEEEVESDVHVEFEPLRAALRYYLAGLVAGILKDERKDDFIHLATMQMGVGAREG